MVLFIILLLSTLFTSLAMPAQKASAFKSPDGSTEIVWNEEKDQFSATVFLTGGFHPTDINKLEGVLQKSGPDKYVGTVSGRQSGGNLGDITDCSAKATLDVSNNFNRLSFSEVECGENLTGIKGANINEGENLRAYDGQKSDATGTATDAPCTANWGFSWLSCMLVENLINLNRLGYEIISGLLQFHPRMVEWNGTVYKYWAQFRNLANVVLLFGFMAIIFSQATSIGLSAYGVKKLLPRLMVFAILINLSFFLCQLAIDASNITGASMQEASSALSKAADLPEFGKEQQTDLWTGVANLVTSQASSGAALGAMAVGGALALPMVAALALPILLVAFLALLVGFAVLVARQIIIIGMVILAPVGIAAAVLPGTKKFYEFWKNTFASMLFMYPIIALLFAGSQLAVSLLGQISLFGGEGIEAGVANALNILVQVIVIVSPFFAIPFVIKTSGGMLGKISGAVDKFSGARMAKDKLSSAVKKEASERATNTMNQARTKMLKRGGIAGRLAGSKGLARRSSYSFNEKMLEKVKAQSTANTIANARPDKYSEGQRAAAKTALSKLELEDAQVLFDAKFKNDPVAALQESLNSKNITLQNIALGELAKQGRVGEISDHFKNATISDEQRQEGARHLMSNNTADIKKDLGLYEMTKQLQSENITDPSSGKKIRPSAIGRGASYDTEYINKTQAVLRQAPASAVASQDKDVLFDQLNKNLVPKRTAEDIHTTDSLRTSLTDRNKQLVDNRRTTGPS